MEYIINPWWFYLISALDSLHIIDVLFAILFALSFVMFDLDMIFNDGGRVKFIGNAYENPELLEQKAEK